MLSMIMTTILRLVLSLPTSDDDDSIAAAATTTTTSHLGRILFCHAVLLSLAIVGHDADLHLRYRRRRWSPLQLCNSELNSTVSSPLPHTHTRSLSLSLSLSPPQSIDHVWKISSYKQSINMQQPLKLLSDIVAATFLLY